MARRYVQPPNFRPGGAADGDQQKERPEFYPPRGDHVGYFRQVLEHVAGDDRMNLRVETILPAPVENLHGAVEGSVDTAKAVMFGGVLAVETQREPNQSRLGEAPDRIACDQRRGRRRHGDPQPFFARAGDDVENIRTLGRIAAGQNQNRIGLAKRFDAVDQRPGFDEAKLSWVSLCVGFGPAMQACEVASASRLPDHGERSLIEIHRFLREQDVCHNHTAG